MINEDIYIYIYIFSISFFHNYSILLIPSLNTKHGLSLVLKPFHYISKLPHTNVPLTLANSRLLSPLLTRPLSILSVLICSACSPLKCPNLTTVVWLQREVDVSRDVAFCSEYLLLLTQMFILEMFVVCLNTSRRICSSITLGKAMRSSS